MAKLAAGCLGTMKESNGQQWQMGGEEQYQQLVAPPSCKGWYAMPLKHCRSEILHGIC